MYLINTAEQKFMGMAGYSVIPVLLQLKKGSLK